MRWHALIALGAISAYTALTLTGHNGNLVLEAAGAYIGGASVQAGAVKP